MDQSRQKMTDIYKSELEKMKKLAGITDSQSHEIAGPINISKMVSEKNLKYGSREYIDAVFARKPENLSMPAGFRGRKKK